MPSPDLLSEIVVRDDVWRGLDQDAQQIEVQRAKLDRTPIAHDPPLRHVDKQIGDLIARVWLGGRCHRRRVSESTIHVLGPQ